MVDLKARTSIFAIIVLIAGIIGIIGVFMAWIEWTADYFAIKYTGWEYFKHTFDNAPLSDITDAYPGYMPLIALIFSVLGLLSGLASVIKPGRAGGSGATVCGVLVLIAAIILVWYFYDKITLEFLGIGVYVCAAAGLLMLIFGALLTSSKTGN